MEVRGVLFALAIIVQLRAALLVVQVRQSCRLWSKLVQLPRVRFSLGGGGEAVVYHGFCAFHVYLQVATRWEMRRPHPQAGCICWRLLSVLSICCYAGEVANGVVGMLLSGFIFF